MASPLATPVAHHRSELPRELIEGTTPIVDFTFKDQNDVGFKPSAVVLTVYNQATGAIVNGRDAQNVVDLNGVTIQANGVTEWRLTTDDTVIVDDTLRVETHVALFEYSWSAGAMKGKHEILLPIRNLRRVPA